MAEIDQNAPLNVMDMLKAYADEKGADEDAIFGHGAATEPTVELDEMGQPINRHDLPVYDADQIETGNEPPVIEDLAEKQTKEASAGQLEEMQRIERNIELSKRRLGIRHLNIPTIYNSRVIDCAADANTARAAEKTDAMIRELIKMFPGAVVEWLPGYGPEQPVSAEPPAETPVATADMSSTDPTIPDAPASLSPDGDSVQLIIDKSNVTELAFSTEELNRIKRAREVEVKIVERNEVTYNIIDEPTDNIDDIISQYTRKFNDRTISLPASRYRCTVTGLSYAEAIDLEYSLQVETLDSEIKRWSMAYAHVKNPSIGRFADFNDFLQKTSSRDLDYLLWAILCATSMSREIVSVDCHHNNCGTSHEWVYSPESLLQLDKIPEFLLEEMKITGTANSRDEIMAHYNESMLRLGNTIELPTSHFVVRFGHVSAYTYLNDGIYADIRAALDADPPQVSSLLEAEIMTSVRYILLPATSGEGYYKITDHAQLKRIIHELDEMDFQTIGQIASTMTEPYKLEFTIKDVVCPKCHNRSDIVVPNLARLLFIIAQGLESANIVLTR